jgi:hypothetical protein
VGRTAFINASEYGRSNYCRQTANGAMTACRQKNCSGPEPNPGSDILQPAGDLLGSKQFVAATAGALAQCQNSPVFWAVFA